MMKFVKVVVFIEFVREYIVFVIFDGVIFFEVIKGDMDFGGCCI